MKGVGECGSIMGPKDGRTRDEAGSEGCSLSPAHGTNHLTTTGSGLLVGVCFCVSSQTPFDVPVVETSRFRYSLNHSNILQILSLSYSLLKASMYRYKPVSNGALSNSGTFAVITNDE